MKTWIQHIVLFSFFLSSLTSAQDEDQAPYEELSEYETMTEVLRYAYRWYLDSADFEQAIMLEDVSYYIVPVEHVLDEGDESLFAEMMFPILGISVRLKKAAYRIEELDLEVASSSFKIVGVDKIEADVAIPDDAQSLMFSVPEVAHYLFETRHEVDHPSPQLLERLEKAAREQMGDMTQFIDRSEDQLLFIAPVSPVANEIWLYWRNAQALLKWHSDVDIGNEAVWEHEQLLVESIDIEKQVVLSLSHASGSNAYYTQDQIGRILYNCLVLGEMKTVRLDRL